MRNISLFIFIVLFTFVSVLFPLVTVYAASIPNTEDAESGDEVLTAEAFIVIDFETNLELCAFNADERRAPASMTKVMSVYLVYEAIANGQIALSSRVPISNAASELSFDDGLTNVELLSDVLYTVDELLDAVIVASACGATLALAEFVGGSNEGFLDMMNSKAEEWGVDASFFNVYGGPTEEQETQVSARAMATIVRNCILDYPEILYKTSMPSLEFYGKEFVNVNRLLGEYEGLDGFKTGYTRAAGACFAGTAQRDGLRIISVVMGCDGNSGRFGDTTVLLDYGFEVVEEMRTAAFPSPSPTPYPTFTPLPTLSPHPPSVTAHSDVFSPDTNADTDSDMSADSQGGGFWFTVFIITIVVLLFAVTGVASLLHRY